MAENFISGAMEGIIPSPAPLENNTPTPQHTATTRRTQIAEDDTEVLKDIEKENKRERDPWVDIPLCNVPIGQHYAWHIGNNWFIEFKVGNDLGDNPGEMVQVRQSVIDKIKSGDLQMPPPLMQQPVVERVAAPTPKRGNKYTKKREEVEAHTQAPTPQAPTNKVSPQELIEALCEQCGKIYKRVRQRGKPPKRCPSCRGV